MTLSQSNITCKRTFRAWLYEYKQMCAMLVVMLNITDLPKLQPIQTEISRSQAEMYYNGGYSPKMVFHEINRIPVGWDIL